MLGCQLWINLPAKEKMTIPTYRDILQDDVPVIKENGAVVRVLSGAYNGKTGPMDGGYQGVQYMDITLEPDREWLYDKTPNDHTLFLYLLEGTLMPAGTEDYEDKGCTMLMAATGKPGQVNDTVSVHSGSKGARFLLVAAKPLHEPVSWGGPIVMNTKEEIDRAFRELDEGTFIRHKDPTFLIL
jgi:quercetin 2,3-dioxygenase